jgi:uncharacterized protein
MPSLLFSGHEFIVVGGTALYWPARKALIVADLHLEKASWFATRGQMLPPHDSMATLERIAVLVTQTAPAEIWCLGDNFHDDDGAHRLPDSARALLSHLTARLDWHWITGNHDEHLPDSVGGTIMREAAIDGIIFRHRADPRDLTPELSGHFHPKYRASSRGRGVSRPCFVASDRKVILPAFGAFTGGLIADHPEIIAAVGSSAVAMVPTTSRMLKFPLAI